MADQTDAADEGSSSSASPQENPSGTTAQSAAPDSPDEFRSFLVALATDPAKLGAFIKDPDASMADANIDPVDQAILKGAQSWMIHARLLGQKFSFTPPGPTPTVLVVDMVRQPGTSEATDQPSVRTAATSQTAQTQGSSTMFPNMPIQLTPVQFPQTLQIFQQFPLQHFPQFPQFPQHFPQFPQFPQQFPQFPQFPQHFPQFPQFPQHFPQFPQFPQFPIHPQIVHPQVVVHPQIFPQQIFPQIHPQLVISPQAGASTQGLPLHPQIPPQILPQVVVHPQIFPQVHPQVVVHPQIFPQVHPQVVVHPQIFPQVHPQVVVHPQIFPQQIFPQVFPQIFPQVHPQLVPQLHPQLVFPTPQGSQG
ncbi:MAG TPA: hypothetical protein VGO49_22870 [Bradyrhizobium sp.]|nr:hypothetical protein [Bradyrhizobium sp.]